MLSNFNFRFLFPSIQLILINENYVKSLKRLQTETLFDNKHIIQTSEESIWKELAEQIYVFSKSSLAQNRSRSPFSNAGTPNFIFTQACWAKRPIISNEQNAIILYHQWKKRYYQLIFKIQRHVCFRKTNSQLPMLFYKESRTSAARLIVMYETLTPLLKKTNKNI